MLDFDSGLVSQTTTGWLVNIGSGLQPDHEFVSLCTFHYFFFYERCCLVQRYPHLDGRSCHCCVKEEEERARLRQ